MIIEIAKFMTEEAEETIAGIEINTKDQLIEYHTSGLAELNEQLHDSENDLSDYQKAYVLILLSVLTKYVTEEKLMQTFSEEHNSMNICCLLAEETVTADIAGKKSMLDLRLQEFSEINPKSNTAVYYNLLKKIAETESGIQESMRKYISEWAEQHLIPAVTKRTLRMARNYTLEQTAGTQDNHYRNLVCFGVKRVIYSGNRTIVLFDDDTKVMATCDEDDTYSRETGLLVCLLKHIYGNKICDLLNDFAEETEKAERNESELVYIQDRSKSAVKKTERANMTEEK